MFVWYFFLPKIYQKNQIFSLFAFKSSPKLAI